MQKRKWTIWVGLLLAAVLLGLGIYWGRAIETGSWGLSFQQEGAAPVGNAGSRQLRPYDAAYVGNPEEKVLYLTFDAGYENGNTEKILDALKSHNAKGAFFLVGNFARDNADLVRRMAAEGHIVGNHTMHHYDMSKIADRETFQQELKGVEELYEQATGKPLDHYYRPPQGVYSVDNLKMAQELGYKTVFWSLAYVDWNQDSQPSHEQAFEKLIPRTHNGAVVLLHQTSKTNGEIMDELLTKWEEMGYRFGTLDELFQEDHLRSPTAGAGQQRQAVC